MKQKLAIIASILFLTFGFASIVVGQWALMYHPFTEVPHPPGGGVRALTIVSPNMFVGGYQGVFHSNNEGTTWDSVGLDSETVHALLFEDSYLYTGTNDGRHGLFLSADQGKSWVVVDSFIHTIQVLAKLDTILFCGAIADLHGNHFYIFRSEDRGLSWTPASTGNYLNPYVTSFAEIDTIFFAGMNGGIASSIDIGKNWTIPDTNLTLNINCLAVISKTLFAGSIDLNKGHILRSTDYGKSWEVVFDKVTFALTVHGSDLYAGTMDAGVFRSIDSGKTWVEVNDGMGVNRINVIAADAKYLFAGDEAGRIWRRSLSDFSSVHKYINSQENITLSPNPTTGIIVIYNAPANILHVTVTNILGESVLELAHPNAPEFTLNLSKLPPGTYIARFSMTNEVITRKIIKE